MRPLFHPSIGDITVEGNPACLSDPVRGRDLCRAGGLGRRHHLLELPSDHDRSIPKSTLSQHFRALREAGLVLSERHGVEIAQQSAAATEIERRFPGLIAAILMRTASRPCPFAQDHPASLSALSVVRAWIWGCCDR